MISPILFQAISTIINKKVPCIVWNNNTCLLATLKFSNLAQHIGDFANSTTCSHVGTSPILLLHMPLKLLIDFCVILFLIIIATPKFSYSSSCFFFPLRSSCSSSFLASVFRWEGFIFRLCLQIHDILPPAISSFWESLVSQFVGLHVPHVFILIITGDNFDFLRLL